MRDWLYEARRAAGVTQEALAEKIGISTAYYSLIETGERQKKMDVTLIVRLSEALGIPVDVIVSNERKED